MEIVDNQGERHWGSYDAVDHGYDARMQSPFGQEQQSMLVPGAQPAAVAPDWQQLLAGAVEQRGNIRVLTGPAAQAVITASAFMTAPPQPPGTSGSTTWVAQPLINPNAWAQSFLGSGYTVLIDVMSPPAQDGSRKLAIVAPGPNAAAEVFELSGPAGPLNPSGPFAVVDGPQQVLQAAAGMQPTIPAPPPGSVPPVPPQQAGMSTGMKVALGVGAVAVIGGVLYAVNKG